MRIYNQPVMYLFTTINNQSVMFLLTTFYQELPHHNPISMNKTHQIIIVYVIIKYDTYIVSKPIHWPLTGV